MTTLTARKAGTWASDRTHSSAAFKVRHFGISWYTGEFDSFDVKVTTSDDGSLAVSGVAQIESLQSADEQLAGHLASPDFFDAQLHPQITFESTSGTVADDGSVVVEGTLTIRGNSKPVTLTGSMTDAMEDPYGGTRAGLELAGEIDRTEFGVSWSAETPAGLPVAGKRVQIVGSFELIAQ